jgi:hypothetical protein
MLLGYCDKCGHPLESDNQGIMILDSGRYHADCYLLAKRLESLVNGYKELN